MNTINFVSHNLQVCALLLVIYAIAIPILIEEPTGKQFESGVPEKSFYSKRTYKRFAILFPTIIAILAWLTTLICWFKWDKMPTSSFKYFFYLPTITSSIIATMGVILGLFWIHDLVKEKAQKKEVDKTNA